MSHALRVRPLILMLAITVYMLLLQGTVFAQCAANMQPCHDQCIPESYICILEPWPGMPSSMPPEVTGSALGPFLYYINAGVWPWIFKGGIAIAIFSGVFGAFNIVTSNGDSGKIDEGKNRFLWSAIGLIILLLSGVILEYLNPVAFSSG